MMTPGPGIIPSLLVLGKSVCEVDATEAKSNIISRYRQTKRETNKVQLFNGKNRFPIAQLY
jgi:hypothetical protein